MTRVLCFAYGSNMLPARLGVRERAPSARVLGAAQLTGYRLTFDKRGADGSGKCSVIQTSAPDAVVHGVIYALAAAEIAALDRAEGGYERVPITVSRGDRILRVETYRAHPHMLRPGLLPFDWYHALVVAGARRGGLPTAYITRLAAQPTVRDHDQERRTRHLALLD